MDLAPRAALLGAALALAFAPDARANATIDINPDSPVLLGMGVDLVTGEFKQPCVEWGGTRFLTTGQGTKLRYQLVEDSRSMKKALGVKARVAYKSPGTHVSGKAAFASEVNANSYSLYILAMVDVKAPTETLADVHLRPEVRELLAQGNLNRFREVCGDEYVASVQRAGTFVGVTEIRTTGTSSKKKIKVELQGKMGGYSASGEMTQAISKVAQRNEVRSYQYVTGQERTALSVSPDQMVKNAENFPVNVDPESALPYRAATFSYQTLVDWNGPAPVDVQHQAYVVAEIGRRQERYREKLADVHYVMANPLEFRDFEPARLGHMEAVIDQNLQRLQRAASECHRDLRECEVPKLLYDEESYQGVRKPLPPRLDTLCYQARADPACGVDRYNERADVLCGVKLYKEKVDKSCGAATYKAARTRACGVELYKKKKSGKCGYTYGKVKTYPLHFGCPKGMVLHKKVALALQCKTRTAKTCRHSSHGVERYKSCRAAAHGAETYKACRKKEWGIELFETCAREEFGVAEYQVCRRPEFGLEKCE